jgi:hypothetical protein
MVTEVSPAQNPGLRIQRQNETDIFVCCVSQRFGKGAMFGRILWLVLWPLGVDDECPMSFAHLRLSLFHLLNGRHSQQVCHKLRANSCRNLVRKAVNR